MSVLGEIEDGSRRRGKEGSGERWECMGMHGRWGEYGNDRWCRQGVMKERVWRRDSQSPACRNEGLSEKGMLGSFACETIRVGKIGSVAKFNDMDCGGTLYGSKRSWFEQVKGLK